MFLIHPIIVTIGKILMKLKREEHKHEELPPSPPLPVTPTKSHWSDFDDTLIVTIITFGLGFDYLQAQRAWPHESVKYHTDRFKTSY